MARSRNIKPGFFKNELLAEVHPLGRLLFEGLWCLADREGRLENRPKRIKAELLPYDNCDIDELLTQLENRGFIIRYEVEGQEYIQILTFKKHQNPHVREAASIIPAYIQLISNEHSKSTVLEQDKHRTSPADSLLLIPDSLNPLTDSLNLIPENQPSAPGNIYKLFEQEFARPLSPMEVEEFFDLENTYGYEFVKEALKRAVIQGVKKIKYIQRILETWRNANLKTIQEVLDYEQMIDDQKTKRKGNKRISKAGKDLNQLYSHRTKGTDLDATFLRRPDKEDLDLLFFRREDKQNKDINEFDGSGFDDEPPDRGFSDDTT